VLFGSTGMTASSGGFNLFSHIINDGKSIDLTSVRMSYITGF
jgi:hypothetical protein